MHFLKKLQNKILQHKIITTICIVAVIGYYASLPNTLFNNPTSYVLTDHQGNVLSAAIADDGQWRFPNTEKVPEKFEKCITTFEDQRFYYHWGVDIFALLRAIFQNSKSKKTVSGGSTISMQVVRLFKQNKKRTIVNKCIEILLATRLECSYRKKSILALYAANAPFGGNVVGLDAAAWRYFGRAPSQLSWGEMAALAVLPNAPSLVHPGKNSTILLRKRNALIDKLLKEQEIDSATATLAKAEPLPNKPKPLPELVPHLLSRYKRENSENKSTKSNSTYAQTTIIRQLQQQVIDITKQHHQHLKGNQINNVAAMVMEVNSGNIIAYVGNIYNSNTSNYEQHVDVLSAVRSPGSTLKPLVYAALLSEGSILPQQLVLDIPTNIGGYTPQNYELTYDGAVPANLAISRSLNIPAVRMLQQYKYQRFYSLLKQMGFTSLQHPADFYGMSLILGGCEINPFELAGVYSSIARVYNHQTINKEMWLTSDWKMPQYVVSSSPQKRKKITPLIDYSAIWHMLNTMNEVMRPGEEGLWSSFSSAKKIAWKTGTSFGNRDAWAIGLTPRYCTVVWVGNTSGEGSPALTGIQTAAPILFDIFRLLPNSEWFQKPSLSFQYLPTCKQSGYKASVDCTNVDTIMVSPSAEKSNICPYCKKITIDKTGKFRVNELCEDVFNIKQQSWFILPPTVEYYYAQKNPSFVPLPPFKSGCLVDASKMIDIIYPEQNAIIYIPFEASGLKGKTIFTATHKNKNAVLYWHLDENYLGKTSNFHQMAINPTVGKHTTKIIDADGNTSIRNFTILEKPQ